MTVTLTWQSIITAGAVIGALITIITVLVKVVRWVDNQKIQDSAIEALKAQHERDMEELKAAQREQLHHIQSELTVICYGLRGALQGLIEKGCNGPCKSALSTLDKHLNQQAHEWEGEV